MVSATLKTQMSAARAESRQAEGIQSSWVVASQAANVETQRRSGEESSASEEWLGGAAEGGVQFCISNKLCSAYASPRGSGEGGREGGRARGGGEREVGAALVVDEEVVEAEWCWTTRWSQSSFPAESKFHSQLRHYHVSGTGVASSCANPAFSHANCIYLQAFTKRRYSFSIVSGVVCPGTVQG